MKHSTNLVIISGPSGSGKDSIIEGMIERGETDNNDERERERERKK